MIEINLAPGSQRGRQSRGRRLKVPVPSIPAFGADPRRVGLILGAMLVLSGIGLGFWRQGERKEELSARIEQEVTDSTRFATTIALVQTLQARQDTVRQKIGLIRDVDQRRYVWPHLLEEISRAVPTYTWLRQITAKAPPAPTPAPGDTTGAQSQPPAGPAFTLEGHAGSTQALTRFMKNLEASPFIREVTLVTSEQITEAGRTLHRFTLEAQYETPDSSVVATVPMLPVE